MVNGGVADAFKMVSSLTLISISPDANYVVFENRTITSTETETTNSLPSFLAVSMDSLEEIPSSRTN